MTTTSTPPSEPTTEEDQLVDLPGFAPTLTTGPDPIPAEGLTETTPTSTTSTEEEGWRSLDDGGLDDAGPGGRPRATPPRATGSSRASTADPRDFQELTHALVAIASAAVRWTRTRRRRDLPPALWVADDEDQAAIGDPLARIAARHSPLDGGDETNDVVDGILAVVGTANYAGKNIQAEAQLGLPDLSDAAPDGP